MAANKKPASDDVDFRLIAESIPQIVWMADPDGATQYFNEQGSRYTGVPREANTGWDWLQLIHPDDRNRAERSWRELVGREAPYTTECRVRRHDGEYRRNEVRATPVRNADRQVVGWIGTVADVEEQRRLEESLRACQRETAESLALLETLLATAPVGCCFVDREFRQVRINEALAATSGIPAAEQVGRLVPEMIPELWPELEPVFRRVLETGEAVVNRETSGALRGDPNRVHTWLTSLYPVRLQEEVIGIGVIVVDITERKEAEHFRATVMNTMADGLYTLDGEGRLTSMNSAASSILGWTEEELLGKDMHSVIHFQHADGAPLFHEDCELLKVRTEGRSVRMARDAFTCKDGTVRPVAYSSAPLDRTPVRGVVVVFRDTSAEQAEEDRVKRELDTLAWVGRIRDALDEDRMVLYSQPIVPLTGGHPSQELLLRMIKQGGEIVPPGCFLPVAEKYGLIGEIDRWVIRRAIAMAAAGERLEANLSAESIGNPDLLPLIERELRNAHANPSNIVFEITETALMENAEAGQAFARGLSEIGCGVALDDFGTGFGTFTYLKNLPITCLKIDAEFVRDLTTNTANQHLVKAIVGLAQDFGLQTVAEGVEDAKTLGFLRENGVDFAQGFHLGRPAAIEAS